MVAAGNFLFATRPDRSEGHPLSLSYQRDNRSIITRKKNCESVKMTAHLHVISKFNAPAVSVPRWCDAEVAGQPFYTFEMRQHVSALCVSLTN